MGSDQVFKMAPALVLGTGAPLGLNSGAPNFRPPHALELTAIYNRKRSSRPMALPPFVIRLTDPASLVRYPTFPVED
ncbi:MAG: hypothetical protein JW753_09240 [Dehalococcoidia bacterium]|nr:hypothetical protein [Dehalococcoidia bacterium]